MSKLSEIWPVEGPSSCEVQCSELPHSLHWELNNTTFIFLILASCGLHNASPSGALKLCVFIKHFLYRYQTFYISTKQMKQLLISSRLDENLNFVSELNLNKSNRHITQFKSGKCLWNTRRFLDVSSTVLLWYQHTHWHIIQSIYRSQLKTL